MVWGECTYDVIAAITLIFMHSGNAVSFTSYTHSLYSVNSAAMSRAWVQ